MAFKIYLYDTEEDCIGSGCLSSAYIQLQMEMAGGQDVEVHISSVGGSAFDAIATYDLLKKYPGNVVTYIDALAASAASIVAMAGKSVVMSKYALLMIHKPMVGTGGNADELLKDVQMLNTVQARLAQIYMDKTGLDDVTINSLINAVTWLSADQALDLGFIDQIEDYTADTPKITNSLLMKKFTDTAPVYYQRVFNKILSNKNKTIMDAENKELIEKSTSVLNKIMNFFKKVVHNKIVTDKGTLIIAGPLAVGAQVFNDEDMEDSAKDDDYEVGNQVVTVKDGKVAEVKDKKSPDDDDDDDGKGGGNDDDDDDNQDPDADPEDKKVMNNLKEYGLKKDQRQTVQARLTDIKAKLTAQNALLSEAREALEAANLRLKKTREEVKNEIKSDFIPEGSKRSAKAKTEPVPFFAPTTDIAKRAVQQSVENKK